MKKIVALGMLAVFAVAVSSCGGGRHKCPAYTDAEKVEMDSMALADTGK